MYKCKRIVVRKYICFSVETRNGAGTENARQDITGQDIDGQKCKDWTMMDIADTLVKIFRVVTCSQQTINTKKHIFMVRIHQIMNK